MNTNDWREEFKDEFRYYVPAIKQTQETEETRMESMADWFIKKVKERDLALIAELEGGRRKIIQTDIEGNTEWRLGYNSALDLIISNLRERIQ